MILNETLRKDPIVGRWTGHALQLFVDRFRLMQRAAMSDDPIVTLHYYRTPIHLCLSPESVREVLVTKTSLFSKDTHGYRQLEKVTGAGILTNSGEAWKSNRILIQKMFSLSRIQEFSATVDRRIQQRFSTEKGRIEIQDLHREMNEFSLELLLDFAFSSSGVSRLDRFNQALSGLLEITHSRIGTRPAILNRLRFLKNARFEAGRRYLEEMVTSLYDALASERSWVRDLLDEGVPPDQAKNELRTLLFAGHETTANALTWILYLLAKSPVWQDRLAESDSKIVDAVIHEGLRLYPPIWSISRKAISDVEVAGKKISQGETVITSPYLLHRSVRLFEKPSDFMPERFLKSGSDQPELFPFGMGPRLCIGRNMAMIQLQRSIAEITHSFRLELLSRDEVRPRATIVLRPDRRISVSLTARNVRCHSRT